jgi:nucleotide-binding universal stress UspA family protein
MSKLGVLRFSTADAKTEIAFKKILLPTDFCIGEKPAWLFALHLAGLHNGEVIIQHVVNEDIPRYAHAAVACDGNEIEKHVALVADNEMKNLVDRLAGGVPVRPVRVKGGIVEEICSLAEKEDVDLIVMGAADGAVAGKVVCTTSRAVLTFPAPPLTGIVPETFKVKNILLATDLSAHSREVVLYAFELKRIFDASIHLLYVIETTQAIEFAITHGQPSHTVVKMKEWALQEMRNLIPMEYAGDPRVVLSVERGSASSVIAAKVLEIGGCLTILGTHRRGLVHPHFRGDTRDRLMTRVDNPVLALKPPASVKNPKRISVSHSSAVPLPQ